MHTSFNKSIISLNNYVNESLQNNPLKANVRHQNADFLVEVTEDSNGVNTDEKLKIDKDEHIPAHSVPLEKKVPLALRRLKYFDAPRKLGKER